MVGGSPRHERTSTVLVVDDDMELRELLSVELESQGLGVETAMNGVEGVNRARTLKPDIILMDLLMPEMNGIEATRMLKKDKDTRHIPVIMVTSEEKQEDMIRGLEAGAIDYITKPFFLPELKARVNAVLRFKSIYDDLISVRDHIIKEQMINTIKQTTSIVQGTIDDNLEVITTKFNNYYHNQQYPSKDDLGRIEIAVSNIKNTVVNLGFLDSFAFKVYETISGIVEKNY